MALNKQVRARIKANKVRKYACAWEHKLYPIWKQIDLRLATRISAGPLVIGRMPRKHAFGSSQHFSFRHVICEPATGMHKFEPQIPTADQENREHVRAVYLSATHHSQVPGVIAKLRKLAVQVTGYEV